MWKLENEVLCTILEFANGLSVKKQTVYYWIAKGMPVIRSDDGKKMILHYEDALEWVKEQNRLGNIKTEVKRCRKVTT